MTATALTIGCGASSASASAPQRTSLRVLVVPVRITGGTVPGPAALKRLADTQVAWFRRASHGVFDLDIRVGAPFDARPYEGPRGIISVEGLTAALDNAAAHGAALEGVIPIYVYAGAASAFYSVGNPNGIQLRGRQWIEPTTVAHEIGHAMGLEHAYSAGCPRPFRAYRCNTSGPGVFKYGDPYDNMARTNNVFGAYAIGQLGWAPITDAPAGRARVTVRPVDRPGPTVLRLRAADRDWYVETRVRVFNDNTSRYVPAGRGVFVAFAKRTPVVDEYGIGSLRPPSYRVPSSGRAVCGLNLACLDKYRYDPGSTLRVPGAFTVRVLRGPGPVRVETRWVDRTPPTLSVTALTIRRVAGGVPEAELRIAARASGAGIAAVEVEHAGSVSRFSADDVRGLANGPSGAGTVRVPLQVPATSLRVRLVDAAGNASAPVDVPVAGAPSVSAAQVAFSSALSITQEDAPTLPGGVLTFNGRTDPSVAGGSWSIEGTNGIVAADGSFSGTFRPPVRGLYRIDMKVPVARLANGSDFSFDEFHGMVRT